MLELLLEQAERRVTQREALIVEQRESIEGLKRHGLVSQHEELVLVRLELLKARYVADRDRLRMQIKSTPIDPNTD